MAKPRDNNPGILLESGTNEVEFLRFGLSDQLYGVNVAKVRQVLVFESQKVCKLPDLPNYLLGELNYRGECIPVIDLTVYYNVPSREQSAPRLLLVLEYNQSIVGFVVDSVDRIMRCSWEAFVPSKKSVHASRKAAVIGTVIMGEEMTPILDVEALLGDVIPESAIDAQVDSLAARSASEAPALHIVYAEDSQTVQRVLVASLQKAGYNSVKVFSTGADALEYLSTEPAPKVDIIVSDIEMPKMDGLSFCKRLRDQPRYKTVPFFFFSSTVTDEMRHKCTSVGGSNAFSKPEVIELVAAIDAIGAPKKQ